MSLAGPILFFFSFWQTLFPLGEELAGKAPTYEGQPARYWLTMLLRGDWESQAEALRGLSFLGTDSKQVMARLGRSWPLYWQRPQNHLRHLGLLHDILQETGGDLRAFDVEVRRLLLHPNKELRSAGLELLLNYHGDELLPFRPLLVQYLPRADEGERFQISKVIARMRFHPAEDAAFLKSLVQHPHHQIRKGALSALRRPPFRTEYVPVIASLLEDKEEYLRTMALELLCVYAREGKADLAYLVRGLLHRDWSMREATLRRLIALGPQAKPCLPALLAAASRAEAAKNLQLAAAILQLDPDAEVGWRALLALCRLSEPELRDPALLRLADLAQTQDRARREVRELLLGPKPIPVTQVSEFLYKLDMQALPTLKELLRHPDKEVRLGAITGLRPLVLKDLEAQRLLVQICRHAKLPEERCQAAMVLAEGARHPEALACLGPMLSEENLPDEVRLLVLLTCRPFMKDDEETAWHVARCLQAKDPEVRTLTLMGFRRSAVRAPWLLTEVEKALRDPELTVRKEAARLLAEWGPSARRALPELYRLRRDPDAGVQIMALLAIVSLEPQPPVWELLPYLQHPREEVSETALTALGKCGPALRHSLPALLEGTEARPISRTLPLLKALGAATVDDERIFKLLLKAWDQGRNSARDLEVVEEAAHVLDRYEKLPAFVLQRLQYHLFHGSGFRRLYAAHLLQKHQPSPLSLAVLCNSLDDQVKYCRWLAVQCLRDRGPEAKRAVPNLLKLLHEYMHAADVEDAVDIATALWHVDHHPEAIPALVFMLENGPQTKKICEVLAEIGPDAHAALPALRAQLQPPHAPWKRPHLLKAIRAIEGEK